jgi:hypothetical protein
MKKELIRRNQERKWSQRDAEWRDIFQRELAAQYCDKRRHLFGGLSIILHETADNKNGVVCCFYFPFSSFLPTCRPIFFLLRSWNNISARPSSGLEFPPAAGRGPRVKRGETKQELHLQRFDSSRAFASIFIRLMKTLAGANCFSNSAITGRWRPSVFFVSFYLFISLRRLRHVNEYLFAYGQ